MRHQYNNTLKKCFFLSPGTRPASYLWSVGSRSKGQHGFAQSNHVLPDKAETGSKQGREAQLSILDLDLVVLPNILTSIGVISKRRSKQALTDTTILCLERRAIDVPVIGRLFSWRCRPIIDHIYHIFMWACTP